MSLRNEGTNRTESPILKDLFQDDDENSMETQKNPVYSTLFQQKLRALVNKHYVNCKTETQLVDVLMELSSEPVVIYSLEILDRVELRELSTKLICEEGNTFFFEHLLYQLHSVSNPNTPIPKSVERVSYFSELWKHVLKCKETSCGMEGCFLSKCILAHFHECSVYDRNDNCCVCRRTRDAIEQGMKEFNRNLIMNHAVEIVPKKTQDSTRKRKAKDVEEPKSVDIFFATDEDDDERVEIKKQKKEQHQNPY